MNVYLETFEVMIYGYELVTYTGRSGGKAKPDVLSISGLPSDGISAPWKSLCSKAAAHSFLILNKIFKNTD